MNNEYLPVSLRWLFYDILIYMKIMIIIFELLLQYENYYKLYKNKNTVKTVGTHQAIFLA